MTYKTIIDKDDIILMKKENKFKLEVTKKVNLPCDIINLTENLEIYHLLKLLNDKLITKCKIIKNTNEPDEFNINPSANVNPNPNPNANSDILLCFNNFFKNKDDSDSDSESIDKNFYITYTNYITKIGNNNIKINGKKNFIRIDKDDYKKIEIDDILLHLELNGSELNIKLKFNYIGDKMPIYAENTIGLIFWKMIKNLSAYYAKN